MNSEKRKYDVFISYRRKTGADDARLLQQALKARGFNVFFDYDSLRDGQFDSRIYVAIEEASIFILMLSDGALDNCVREDDWVRLEINHALKNGRKIIPVAVNPLSWVFPANFPKELESVKTEQISEINKAALFEESVDKIVKDRFPISTSSNNRFPVKVLLCWVAIICMILCGVFCCEYLPLNLNGDNQKNDSIDLDNIESWPCEFCATEHVRKLKIMISRLEILEEEEQEHWNIEKRMQAPQNAIKLLEAELQSIDKSMNINIKESSPVFGLNSKM